MVRNHLPTSASTVCLYHHILCLPSVTGNELSLLPSVASLCAHILEPFPSHLKNSAPTFILFLLIFFFFFNVLDHFCLYPNTSPILQAEKPSLNSHFSSCLPISLLFFMQCSSGEFSVLTFSLLFAHFDSLVNPLKLGFHTFQSTTEVFIKSHQPNIARSNSSQIFFLISQYHFDIIKYSLLFEVISSLSFLDTTGNLFFAVF